MAKINLLPWREERREQRNKQFKLLAGAVAAAALLVGVLSVLYVGSLVTQQENRNATLKQEIAKLTKKTDEIKELKKKKEELIRRKTIIDDLQAKRSKMVHLFDELVKTIPQGVKLDNIKQNGDSLSISGIAQSDASVSSYMRTLDQSEWITSPSVKIIETKGDNPNLPKEFELGILLTKPGKNTEKKEDGEEVIMDEEAS